MGTGEVRWTAARELMLLSWLLLMVMVENEEHEEVMLRWWLPAVGYGEERGATDIRLPLPLQMQLPLPRMLPPGHAALLRVVVNAVLLALEWKWCCSPGEVAAK